MSSEATSAVGVYDLKTHLSAVLERVEAGEVVTITRHGNPIAYLSPTHARLGSAAAAVQAIMQTPRSLMTGQSIDDLVKGGRRF